ARTGTSRRISAVKCPGMTPCGWRRFPRRGRRTSFGVAIRSRRKSWSVTGRSRSRSCKECTVVATRVESSIAPNSRPIAYSRSENPPPFPTRAPPRAPGKRASPDFSRSDQTFSRILCFSASIRLSFTMARHSLREARALLLTGARGSGKTTIVRRVASELSGARLRGFTTAEIRKDGKRVGFRIETFDGESAVLAHVSLRSEHRVGRYGVDVASLDRIVASALS